MAVMNINKDEQTLLHDAVEQAINSARRQQNMKGRTITIREVYQKHERVLQTLLTKVDEAK